MSIEWALLLPPSRKGENGFQRVLDRASSWTASPRPGLSSEPYGSVMIRYGAECGFRRLYWGCEFCQVLIPSVENTLIVADLAKSAGMSWTLLTPYVTDHGLDRLQRLMGRLPESSHPDEAVVNDWGVLRWLNREYPRIEAVLGRLMNKMVRDPRVASHYLREDAPAEALRAVREFSLTAESYSRFLENSGVKRVEIDNTIQGFEMDFEQLGFRSSLYLPFGLVTTGRICLPGSLGLPAEKKFSLLGRCARECEHHVLELKNSQSPFAEDRGLALFQRGNTVFYSQSVEQVERGLQSALHCGIDRVVWQSELPM